LEDATLKDAGRCARSFSDFEVRYGVFADLLEDSLEDSAKLDDVCKATAETCSSAGSSMDLIESWADMADSDTESDESEIRCATPQAPEKQFVQQVMMPMGFVLMPMAQTNMMWGCQGMPQACMMPGNQVRSRIAPPPGNFSQSSVEVKKPEMSTVVLRNLPSHLSRSDLVKILDDAGFSERYDFVYCLLIFAT
jgi:hypothetical protein